MPKLILQESSIEEKTDGECIIYDPHQECYFAWLKSGPAPKRLISLKGVVRLKAESNKTLFELGVPRAAESSLRLSFRQRELQYKTSLGLQIDSIEQTKQGDQILISGHARPLRLQWNEPQKKLAVVDPLVESIANQTVRISQRSISHLINLEIDGNLAPLKEVRVRLPRGTTFSPNRSSKDYLIEVEQDNSAVEDQVLLIRSLNSPSDKWKISLSADRTIDGSSTEATYSVTGFEVLNAYRQSGTLLLQVDTPLQAYFDLEDNLQQVPLPEGILSSSETKSIGCFKHSRGPWSLSVHVLPQKRRVSVRPDYELTIGPQEARLELDFSYQFTGAKTYFVRIDLQGWQLTDDPIDSGGAIDDQLYTITQRGLVNLPLLNPETGKLRLKLVTKKNLSTGLQRFPLPEPLGVFVTDGQLQVKYDPSLEIIPRMDASEGLSLIQTAESLGSQSELGNSDSEALENEPLRMNFRAYRSDPILEVELLRRDQEIRVNLETQVTLGPQVADVKQFFQYEVLHRPSSQLLLHVPSDLWKNDSFTLRLGEEDLEFGLKVAGQDETALNAMGSEVDPSQPKPIIVALPRPLEGRFLLEGAYRIPTTDVAPTTSTPFFLPLATPKNSLLRHVAKVRCTGSLEAVVHQGSPGEDWSLVKESQDLNGLSDDLRLEATKPSQELPLLLQLKQEEEANLASIERVWLQSWLLEDKQQTRAVFLFRSEHSSVSVLLPKEDDIRAVEVLLDKQPVPFYLSAANRLRVDLPAPSRMSNHTLELRYVQPIRLPNWGSITTSLPELQGQASISPAYWQVVVPSRWVVGLDPTQMIGDYSLGWKNSQWGRQPSLDQDELEQLLDATKLSPPPQTMHRYLYQTFQMPSSIQLTLYRTYWISLGLTSLFFGIGLVCIYTPIVRSKLFWLAMVLFLFILASSFPELTLAIVQALTLGFGITLIAFMLKRTIDSNTPFKTHTPLDRIPNSTAVTESWSLIEHDSALRQQETTASVPMGGRSE